MPLAEKQRTVLIQERGEPSLRLEFDVFADGQVSMWTHFEHGSDFAAVKNMMTAIHKHLTEFMADEGMCPFSKAVKGES